MTKSSIKNKVKRSLTLKIVLGCFVIVVLGLVYNLIVSENDSPLTEDEQSAEQLRKADQDTIDVIGDYLWPRMKAASSEVTSEEKEKIKEEDQQKEKQKPQVQPSASKTESDENLSPVPEPAPATTPQPAPEQPSVPTIEKFGAPKVEKID